MRYIKDYTPTQGMNECSFVFVDSSMNTRRYDEAIEPSAKYYFKNVGIPIDILPTHLYDKKQLETIGKRLALGITSKFRPTGRLQDRRGGNGVAKLSHCGVETKATAYRLASSKPAYRFQHLKHCIKCKSCGKELMEWRGEYQEGDKFTAWLAIPASEFDHWKRRIKAGEAKPEAQLMSEWAERAARPADIAVYYHNTIEIAKRRYPTKQI